MLENPPPYLAKIRETYETLDGWRARARWAEEPEPGSELAGDTYIWRHHPPFEVARQSLVSAGEHLNLARAAFEAGEVFPSAHFTVLRGALVGAVQGVWLLHPADRHTRQQRALRVIHEWYKNRIAYNRGIDRTEVTYVEGVRLAAQDVFLADRMADAKQHWREADGLTARQELNLTAIIEEVATAAFDKPSQRAAAVQLWREMSGDAHVLGWQLALRAQAWQAAPSSRLGVGYVGGDFRQLAQPFYAAHMILRQGWGLFDTRSEARNQ